MDGGALPGLTVRTESVDGLTHVRLAGELDYGTAPRFARELSRLAGADRRIVLDLRGLVFLDSSGLAAILRFHRSAKDAAWDLVVVRGPEPVDRVFRLTRTDRLLALLDVPPDADAGAGAGFTGQTSV